MDIFISYAREDLKDAKRLYTDLNAAGFEPWLDEKNIRGGQRWESAIQEAISHCQFFVALLSSRSVDKHGYVQKEVRRALEILEQTPELKVFLIPVRLDECKPSIIRLRELNWIDMFPNWNAGLGKLLFAIASPDGKAVGNQTLEILKRIYLESDGNERQMVDAIRGLQGKIDKTSLSVTDAEWEYIEKMCPASVVDLLSIYFKGARELPEDKAAPVVESKVLKKKVRNERKNKKNGKTRLKKKRGK